MRTTKFIGLILFVLVALAFFSCAPKSNVVGKWANIKDRGTIEFREDGTFGGVDNMGATFTGNYMIDNDNIRLEITHSNIMREAIQPESSPQVINAKISVNEKEIQFMFQGERGGEIEIERYQRDNQ